MAQTVEADWETIQNLAEEIKKSVKKLIKLNDDLLGDLKKLGMTFRDEGFSTVEGCTKKSKKKISEVLPDLETVIVYLLDYARILKEAKDAIKKGQ
jgi:hypothetical protein